MYRGGKYIVRAPRKEREHLNVDICKTMQAEWMNACWWMRTIEEEAVDWHNGGDKNSILHGNQVQVTKTECVRVGRRKNMQQSGQQAIRANEPVLFRAHERERERITLLFHRDNSKFFYCTSKIHHIWKRMYFSIWSLSFSIGTLFFVYW